VKFYGPPCMTHNVQHPVEVPDEKAEILGGLGRWNQGRIQIQEIPGLTATEREILLTGTCQEVWDSMFPDEECDGDCDGSPHPGLFCR
jgi:hypothetical protein